MSGSSTLRICLAAMAPALTEAASARLKLQESPVKSESLSGIRLDKVASETKIAVLQRPGQVISGDLNALGSLKGAQGDRRVSHLSHTSSGTHADPKRSVCESSSTHGSPIAPGLVADRSLSSLKTLGLKSSPIDSYYVAEDFQGGVATKEAASITLLDNLRIMNQPQRAGDRSIEQNKTHKGLGSNVGLDGEIVAKPETDQSVAKIKIKPPAMVNGDNELTRKEDSAEDVIDCNETGDAPARKGLQQLDDLSFRRALQNQSVNSTNMGIRAFSTKSSSGGIVESEAMLKPDSLVEEKTKEDMRKECGKKQAILEKKVDTLLRRLKRMKGKVVEAHTREQLRQFINFQHRNLQNVAKTIKNETPGPEELKEYFLSNEEVKNMSTAQLVKLVKTYQPNRTVAIAENNSGKFGLVGSTSVMMDPTLCSQSMKTAERLGQRVSTAGAELDSDATASSSGGESGDEDSVSPPQHLTDLPPLLKRAEWKWAIDRAAVVSRWTWLQAQVSDLEYRIRQQSQVHRQLRTSKGGVVLGDPPTTVEILRRLQGITPRQGAAVGSEGNTIGDGSPKSEVSPCNVSSVMSNVDKQASRLTLSLGNCLSPANSSVGSPAGSSKISSPFVNGLTDSPCSSTTETETTTENSPMVPTELRLTGKTSDLFDHSTSSDATCQSARCRPLRSYRKRKILRTIGLYKNSQKAARLSDVRCRCYPPANPCPICGGRYNNTLTIDPDTMSFKERVAFLDPSFHSVLSFPQDIHLPIHCEGLLKSGLWQHKPPPRRSRVGEYRRQKVITLVTEPVSKNGNRRQNGRNSSTASVINFSAKIKNKYETKSKVKATSTKGSSLKPHVNKAKRKAAKAAREAMKKNHPDDDYDNKYFEDFLLEQEIGTPGRENGLTGSTSQSSLKDIRDGHQRKRKVDNSFDINNIVIPLSMAASTRVEQPQYKEIVTPKWREVEGGIVSETTIDSSLTKKLEKTNGVTIPIEPYKLEVTEDELEEDLSDEKFATRHLKLEQEEKKRFRNFVQYPPVRRNRARSEAAYPALWAPSDKEGDVKRNRPRFETVYTAVGTNTDKEGDANTGLLPVAGENSSRPSTPLLNKSLPTSLLAASMEDSIDALQHQLSVRRRTMSFSKRERSASIVSEDLHSSLIEVNGVEPWPRRMFPLSEDEYELMREDLPSSCEPVHQRVTRRLAEPSGKVYVGGSVEHVDDASAAPSPHPSNESISSAGDDPNDPEWVGGDVPKRSRIRRVIDDPNDPEWTGSDTPRKIKNKR